MKREAIGLIEAIGLGTAIVAADAAVKSANVRLIGYEACKGDGMSTIKVAGDVGAVKVAIEAASAACAHGRGVFSAIVIARPSDELEKMIYNDQTIGYTPPEKPKNSESIDENKNEESIEEESTDKNNIDEKDSSDENSSENSDDEQA